MQQINIQQTMTKRKKKIPEVASVSEPTPQVNISTKQMPSVNNDSKQIPSTINMQNVIEVGGVQVEIKPTKLKYQRNRTAAFYHVLQIYPLPDILAMDQGYIDPSRDGDKCLFDWLCAVFDDPEFVSQHYEQMTSETIYKLIDLFKKLNKITQKEQQAKNRAAKMDKA